MRLIFSYNQDFILEWTKSREKGFFKYLVKMVIISFVIFTILGCVAIFQKRKFYGFEYGEFFFITMTSGVIIGVIISIFSWIFNNKRYDELNERIRNKIANRKP